MAFPGLLRLRCWSGRRGELVVFVPPFRADRPIVKSLYAVGPDCRETSQPVCCSPVASCLPDAAGKTEKQLVRFPTSTSLTSNPEVVTEKILSGGKVNLGAEISPSQRRLARLSLRRSGFRR